MRLLHSRRIAALSTVIQERGDARALENHPQHPATTPLKARRHQTALARSALRSFDSILKTLILLLAAGFPLMSVVGCGGPSSPSTTNVDVSGFWQGTATSTGGITSSVTFTLSQSGTSVTGTYTCSSFTCSSSTGTITGTVSGNSVKGTVSYPGGGGCNTLNGTVSGNQMTGNYACQTTFGGDQGTFSVTKQASPPSSTVSGRWDVSYNWTFSQCAIPPGSCTSCVTNHSYSVTQTGATIQGASLDSQAAQITGSISGTSLRVTVKESFPGSCTRSLTLTGTVDGRRITGTVSGGDDNCGTCRINGTFVVDIR